MSTVIRWSVLLRSRNTERILMPKIANCGFFVSDARYISARSRTERVRIESSCVMGVNTVDRKAYALFAKRISYVFAIEGRALQFPFQSSGRALRLLIRDAR